MASRRQMAILAAVLIAIGLPGEGWGRAIPIALGVLCGWAAWYGRGYLP